MNNSDTLLKAAINRVSARLGEKIIDTAAKLADSAKVAPENLRQEWELLKEEIYQEAERLENESMQKDDDVSLDDSINPISPIEKIDLIREKVSKLNKKIENSQ